MDKKHEAVKRKLQVFGKVLLPIGVLCIIVAMIDFFVSMSNWGSPKLFFLFFLGMPLTFAGSVCLSTGYRREMMRYGKNETMPIIKETAPEVKEIIDGLLNKNEIVKCQRCGEINSNKAKFCSGCGVELKITCKACGEKIESDDNYCNKCGARLK